jgi:hypothetical protein
VNALAVVLATLLAAQDAAPASRPANPAPAEVRSAVDRGVRFLLADQNKDGSWGGVRNHTFTDAFGNAQTHETWRFATTGLVCASLVECATGPEAQEALARGVAFLTANADVKRPANWDIDNVWSYVFGLQGAAKMLGSGRFSGTPSEESIRGAAAVFVEGLRRYQSPNGGWAYYADAEAAWRPEWATSFTTAAAVLALADAKEQGIRVPHLMAEKAMNAVKKCRLPTGAYTYSVSPIPSPGKLTWIDQVKGSLGRIQVCDLAIHRAGGGLPLADRRRALAQLSEHHRFLDVALRKPIPHEAYYFNSAYFYLWAHHYGAMLLETLPVEDQKTYWPMIQREVMKTQEKDGAMWDFYMSGHTKPYGTAFGIMALTRSVKGGP